jgi:eukaryotic-like serine/threonine-protein kinase
VVEQSIPPGRTARRRAVIQVRLSSGLPFVAVPALAGQDEDEASQELTRLRLKVTVTRTNDERVAEGKVIRTSPAALTRLREGQTVTVVVSAGKPKIQVPDVAGQPLEQARKALTDDGFKVVDRAEPNDQVPAGTVIGTDPPTGTEVERGSQVTLVVSQGTNQVTVPNVEGMGRDQAIAIIAQAGLRPVIDVEDLFKDQVKKQEPDPGTLVPRGSPVRLKLD